MKWKPLIWLLAALLTVCLLFPVQIYRLLHPPTQQDLLGKVFNGRQDYFDVVTSSQPATAQILHRLEINDHPDFEKLSSYNKSEAVSVSSADLEKIKTLLVSPKSYQWDSDNKCTPNYGVLLKFRSNEQTVRIALCFECDLMGVFIGEDDSKTKISRNWFKSVRKPMVEVVKSIFPDDKEIQALK